MGQAIVARITRLFTLVELLRQTSQPDAGSIASRLNVSVRTLYRDVDLLRQCGYDVLLSPAGGEANRKALKDIALPITQNEREALARLLSAVESVPAQGHQSDAAKALRKALDLAQAESHSET